MAEAWHFARSSRICAGSGVPIEAGKPFYSALMEKDDSFTRVDYSTDFWREVDKKNLFSYWRNKGVISEPDKPQIDLDRLLAFFDSLEGQEDPNKRLFRYVLALVLARRRRLRLDDMSRTADGDRLTVYDRRSNRILPILAPEATREELEKIQEQLNQLFECDFAEDE